MKEAKEYCCLRVEHDFWDILIVDGERLLRVGCFDENLDGCEMVLHALGFEEKCLKNMTFPEEDAN